MLDLDSGVFTCFTPGYYTVSFSAYSHVGPSEEFTAQHLFLYKNSMELPESAWYVRADSGAVIGNVGFTSSRIVVRNFVEIFTLRLKFDITFPPDSPHEYRRYAGAENDERQLHPFNHSQH